MVEHSFFLFFTFSLHCYNFTIWICPEIIPSRIRAINTVREICEEGVQFSRMKSGASFIMAKTRRRVDD